MGAYQLVISQFDGLIQSLSAFASINFVIFAISAALAVVSGVILTQGIMFLPGFNTFYACTAQPTLQFAFSLINLADRDNMPEAFVGSRVRGDET